MRDDHRLAADSHPVPKLHEVIDDHAIFHHRVFERTTIDRRVGSNFNIVANHNRRELFDFHPSLCAGRIAKAIGTDCCVGVNHAPLADFHSVTDHGTGLDHRIGTNTCAVADVSARANPDPVSQQHIRLYACARINGDINTNACAVCNGSVLMDLPAAGRMVIEDTGRFGKGHIGPGA